MLGPLGRFVGKLLWDGLKELGKMMIVLFVLFWFVAWVYIPPVLIWFAPNLDETGPLWIGWKILVTLIWTVPVIAYYWDKLNQRWMDAIVGNSDIGRRM